MARPSEIIVLVEDRCHQQFVWRYLRHCGLEQHAMRFVPHPAGTGSGEQWVRERFAEQVGAYRRRRARAKTALIVVIDADNLLVQERLAQLDRKLDEAQANRIRPDAEQIARLVPRRNIETWILYLNEFPVDEETDYKKPGNDWPTLIRSGIETLYNWTRPNAQLPDSCISSLQLGVAELKKLDFPGPRCRTEDHSRWTRLRRATLLRMDCPLGESAAVSPRSQAAPFHDIIYPDSRRRTPNFDELWCAGKSATLNDLAVSCAYGANFCN